MKKLKSKLGVSVLEMLTAVLVLAILTAGGVTATAAVMSDYTRMSEAANAEILASTVAEAISNEIRIGRDIAEYDVDPTATPAVFEGITLDSAFFGDNAVIKLDDEGRLVAVIDGVREPRQILSEDAYSGLHLKDLTFKKVEGGTPGATTGRTVFVFEFTVYSDLSDNLWHDSVSAAPVID